MASTDNGGASEKEVFRVASVAGIAAGIEYYDFFIYGLAAALVFPAVIFPEQSPVTAALLSFATFGIGFLARPLGGVVFGHFGDVVGRKKTLVTALVLMGVASTTIGLLPSFAAIGVAAPILLVLFRFAQGIAIGGQQGGVVLLAVEAAPPHRRGFFGSFASLGAPVGVLLANGIFLSVTAVLSREALLSWGWRVPFLFSLALVVLAIYIHLKLEDTPAFQKLQSSNADGGAGQRQRSPILTALTTYPREIALTSGTYLGINLAYYIFITYLIAYGTDSRHLGLSHGTLIGAVLIGSVGQIVFLPLAGAISDRFGRQRIMMVGAAGLAVVVFPFWIMVDTGSFWLISLAMLIGLGVFQSLVYGVQPAYFSEIFPTEIRYSGLSLGMQIGSILGGAFAPVIATALISRFSSTSIAIYMSAASLITLFSVWRLGETRPAVAESALRLVPDRADDSSASHHRS
ncbi:shikimate transporter [Mycolicibacterium murale]|jgi:MFS family permease|uniref:Shikimate transporter n=1 Tax=Mycolicibacterium murale TaxID=182220 RepID=A0A7I9WQA6_9MYCO|nr:MFS transporter [Mycolicibacterium murale]MCV7183661.1 MHS family MFS transporter [Mycolicibacterium murale]GFG59803.1 shikimate transporter [Mycolicibacterium murale]